MRGSRYVIVAVSLLVAAGALGQTRRYAVVQGSEASRRAAMAELVQRAKKEPHVEKAAMDWLKAGNIAASLNLDEEAERYYREIIPLSSYLAGDAYLYLAQLRQRQDRPNEAIEFAYAAISPKVTSADPSLREAALTVAFDNVVRLEPKQRTAVARQLYAELLPTESGFFRFSYQEWNPVDPKLAALAISKLERRPALADEVAYFRLEQLRRRYPTGTEPQSEIEKICRVAECTKGAGIGVGHELAMAAYREDDLETAKKWVRVVLDAPRRPKDVPRYMLDENLRQSALRLAEELKIDGPYRQAERTQQMLLWVSGAVGIGLLAGGVWAWQGRRKRSVQ